MKIRGFPVFSEKVDFLVLSGSLLPLDFVLLALELGFVLLALEVGFLSKFIKRLNTLIFNRNAAVWHADASARQRRAKEDADGTDGTDGTAEVGGSTSAPQVRPSLGCKQALDPMYSATHTYAPKEIDDGKPYFEYDISLDCTDQKLKVCFILAGRNKLFFQEGVGGDPCNEEPSILSFKSAGIEVSCKRAKSQQHSLIFARTVSHGVQLRHLRSTAACAATLLQNGVTM